MTKKINCIVCSKKLEYYQEYKNVKCYYCKKDFLTNVTCIDGHYVCDECHSNPAKEIITQFCKETNLIDPIIIANEIFKKKEIKIHGPEHHYLVPAVLITSYYNLKTHFI